VEQATDVGPDDSDEYPPGDRYRTHAQSAHHLYRSRRVTSRPAGVPSRSARPVGP
jgi:hypothetical protein